jgi:hypothetical protein
VIFILDLMLLDLAIAFIKPLPGQNTSRIIRPKARLANGGQCPESVLALHGAMTVPTPGRHYPAKK